MNQTWPDAGHEALGGAWDTPAGPGATVFRVLGAVDARVGERRVDLGAPRQRCLLALLLIEVTNRFTWNG